MLVYQRRNKFLRWQRFIVTGRIKQIVPIIFLFCSDLFVNVELLLTISRTLLF